MSEEVKKQEVPVKIDWVKHVEGSNGKAIFVPDELKKRFKEVQSKRDVYNKKCEKMAEEEITMNIESQNIFFEMRKYIAKEGHDVWLKDIGLEMAALRDGLFIVNINDKPQR